MFGRSLPCLCLAVMARHVILGLLLLVFLASASPAVGGPLCDPCYIARQIFHFCPYIVGVSMLPCCVVVIHVVEAGYDDIPPCICMLDRCEVYVVTGYNLDDMLTSAGPIIFLARGKSIKVICTKFLYFSTSNF